MTSFIKKTLYSVIAVSVVVGGSLAALVYRHMSRINEIVTVGNDIIRSAHQRLLESARYYWVTPKERYVILEECVREAIEDLLKKYPEEISRQAREHLDAFAKDITFYDQPDI